MNREIRKEEAGKLQKAEQHGIAENLEELEDHDVVREGDYALDEKARSITLTDQGSVKMEERLGDMMAQDTSLFDYENIEVLHHINQALKAHYLFRNDVDYVVQDNQVVIVDEFTGRLMPGRRFSDGLHQALEAKEQVVIEKETQTMATITIQNYFRMYSKLAGMTGTAVTEAQELMEIYKLDVVEIPTNQEIIRADNDDLVYRTKREKYNAVIDKVQELSQKGQPILVGTTSVEESETLARMLKRAKVPHNVLNAKQHQKEAEVITRAGQTSAVTISTNMAGRGTDIVLGGKPLEDITEKEKAAWKEKHDAVIKAGGLHIIGTERNESRRVDNQLRGRSGRQGDIGSTRFYLSLEDSLMKIFASEKTASMMKKLGMKEGEALEHSWLNRTIENAQRKVEGMHYDARKHLLEYDDVANDQRKVIYQLRDELMGTEDVKGRYNSIREKVIGELFEEYISPQMLEEDWDKGGLESALKAEYGLYISLQKSIDDGLDVDEILGVVLQGLIDSHDAKEAVVGAETMRTFEKAVMLRALDHHWKEHLAVMDHLRQSVNLRGYAQKNPVQEFKRESFTMFTSLLETINTEMVKALCSVNVDQKMKAAEANVNERQTTKAGADQTQNTTKAKPAQLPKKAKKIGRNDPCPCGSGKKYKHCHG